MTKNTQGVTEETLTDSRINELAQEHGLTAEGYWSEDAIAFGRDLLRIALAAQPQAPVALTPEQIERGLHAAVEVPTVYERAAFGKGVRFAERAHASVVKDSLTTQAPAEGGAPSDLDWLDLPGAVAAWNRIRRAARALNPTGSIAETLNAAAALADLAFNVQPKGTAAFPEQGSKEVNDACWAFVEAMPHTMPGPIWNDLKPALYAALKNFAAATQATAPAPQLPAGWRLAKVSDGDIRVYGPDKESWLIRKDSGEGFYDFIHRFFDALATQATAPAPSSTDALRKMLDLANEGDSARWEVGFRNIVAVLYGPTHRFEIADVVERVRTLADQSPAVGAWQPIETAPKDEPGFVLLGNADEGWREQAWWDDDRREWWSVNTHWTDAYSAPLHPTHWLRLPAPPEVKPPVQGNDK